jgi:hypothetical protein
VVRFILSEADHAIGHVWRQGFASSDLLVVDFEQRKVALESMRTQLAELQDQHRLLHDQSKTLTATAGAD